MGYLILPILLLFFVSSVNAETSNITATDSGEATTNAANKLKTQLQMIRVKTNDAITQAKEDTKALMQTRKEEFKTRIQTIKDQKKKVLVERIDAKIVEINKNHTAKFTEVLNRLQTFLDKIKSTANTTALVDVVAAQASIDAAKSAVEVQAAKIYIMTITDDSTLRLNAGTATSQLRQDLMAVYKLIIDAKQAVLKLKTDKIMMKKEATNSANL